MFVSPRSDYITPRDANGLALASSPRTPHGSDHASTKQDVLVTVRHLRQATLSAS